jgi:hypothetical protein
MVFAARVSNGGFAAAIAIFAVACGGTSVSHVDEGGMAGTSEPGVGGTTGGSVGAGTGGSPDGGGGSAGTSGSGGDTGAAGAFACCVSDGECGHSACLPGDTNCIYSVCVNGECKLTTSGECWRDDQCGPGGVCSGAFVCGCAADCSRDDTPGVCMPKAAGCCVTNLDCPDGSVCAQGVCKAKSATGCWVSGQCTGGGSCFGVSVCPCGFTCFGPDTPGSCTL